jgi:hypothetical protein
MADTTSWIDERRNQMMRIDAYAFTYWSWVKFTRKTSIEFNWSRESDLSYARPFFTAAASFPAFSHGRFGFSAGALSRSTTRSY